MYVVELQSRMRVPGTHIFCIAAGKLLICLFYVSFKVKHFGKVVKA